MAITTCIGTITGECDGQSPTCTSPLTAYTGAVFATYCHSYIDDDDYYVLAYDFETRAVVSFLYDTTRWASVNHVSFTVDAAHCPEVMDGVRDYFARKHAAAIAAVGAVEPGAAVVSTSRRGKNAGFTGTVVRTAPSKYDRDARRVLVRSADGDERWLDAARLQRCDDADATARVVDTMMRLNGWDTLMTGRGLRLGV